jgi:predicted TIM-barrel fold metal-dependent hydrolase
MNDPIAALRMVEEFSGKKGVIGFLVTTVRYKPLYDNAYMKLYRALEERGLPLAFHAATNWGDQSMHITNRFIATHALGFTWFNIVHMTNWVVNGIPERFPGLAPTG